jgi:hypothetical protein
LKERSERIEGGSVLERGKRAGGMGKTTIFYLPSLTIQNRGAEDREADRCKGRGAGDLVHSDGREVGQDEEEVEGNSFRSSPWSGTDCGGRSTAAGGLQPRRHGRRWCWRWRAREGGGIARGGAGRGGEPGRAFYRCGKAVRVRIFEL